MKLPQTPGELWAMIAAVLGAFALLYTTAEKLINIIKAAKAPDEARDKRMDKMQAEIDELKGRLERAEGKLNNDNARFEELNASTRITQQALIALLEHGLNGNNDDQMESAKHALEMHLINK